MLWWQHPQADAVTGSFRQPSHRRKPDRRAQPEPQPKAATHTTADAEPLRRGLRTKEPKAAALTAAEQAGLEAALRASCRTKPEQATVRSAAAAAAMLMRSLETSKRKREDAPDVQQGQQHKRGRHEAAAQRYSQAHRADMGADMGAEEASRAGGNAPQVPEDAESDEPMPQAACVSRKSYCHSQAITDVHAKVYHMVGCNELDYKCQRSCKCQLRSVVHTRYT